MTRTIAWTSACPAFTGKDLNGPKRQRKHLARIQAFTDAALATSGLNSNPPLHALVRKLQVRRYTWSVCQLRSVHHGAVERKALCSCRGCCAQPVDTSLPAYSSALTFHAALYICRQRWPVWRTCPSSRPPRCRAPATAITPTPRPTVRGGRALLGSGEPDACLLVLFEAAPTTCATLRMYECTVKIGSLNLRRLTPADGPGQPAGGAGGAVAALQAAAVQGAGRRAVAAGLLRQRRPHRAARHHGRH